LTILNDGLGIHEFDKVCHNAKTPDTGHVPSLGMALTCPLNELVEGRECTCFTPYAPRFSIPVGGIPWQSLRLDSWRWEFSASRRGGSNAYPSCLLEAPGFIDHRCLNLSWKRRPTWRLDKNSIQPQRGDLHSPEDYAVPGRLHAAHSRCRSIT